MTTRRLLSAGGGFAARFADSHVALTPEVCAIESHVSGRGGASRTPALPPDAAALEKPFDGANFAAALVDLNQGLRSGGPQDASNRAFVRVAPIGAVRRCPPFGIISEDGS